MTKVNAIWGGTADAAAVAALYAPDAVFHDTIERKTYTGVEAIAAKAAANAASGFTCEQGSSSIRQGNVVAVFHRFNLGGPTFPAIFASVCVALALSLLFPGLRVDMLIGGVMAGFLMVIFRAPLMVILLTTVMLQASPELMALIVLAVATVMVVQPVVLAVVARRQAAHGGAAPGPAPTPGA